MVKKITLEGNNVPKIITRYNSFILDYGAPRGSQKFTAKFEAQQVMLYHLNDRIHSTVHQLEALCKCQRKLLKDMIHPG